MKTDEWKRGWIWLEMEIIRNDKKKKWYLKKRIEILETAKNGEDENLERNKKQINLNGSLFTRVEKKILESHDRQPPEETWVKFII